MGGWWYLDHEVRIVQCPNENCKRVFKSGKKEPQCSNCHMRFWGDYNLYKTSDDRKNDRVQINELIKKYRENQNQMMEMFRKKNEENNSIIQKINELIKPFE